MTRVRLAIAAGAAALVPLILFALFNRGQPLALTFGLWRWRMDAVVAIYGAIGIGLVVMFLLGLPADLAARHERERLAQRVGELEPGAAREEEAPAP